jgi:hypothetical protein
LQALLERPGQTDDEKRAGNGSEDAGSHSENAQDRYRSKDRQESDDRSAIHPVDIPSDYLRATILTNIIGRAIGCLSQKHA